MPEGAVEADLLRARTRWFGGGWFSGAPDAYATPAGGGESTLPRPDTDGFGSESGTDASSLVFVPPPPPRVPTPPPPTPPSPPPGFQPPVSGSLLVGVTGLPVGSAPTVVDSFSRRSDARLAADTRAATPRDKLLEAGAMASRLGADERGDLGLEPLQGGTRGIYASGVDGKWAECDTLITIPSARVPVHEGALRHVLGGNGLMVLVSISHRGVSYQVRLYPSCAVRHLSSQELGCRHDLLRRGVIEPTTGGAGEAAALELPGSLHATHLYISPTLGSWQAVLCVSDEFASVSEGLKIPHNELIPPKHPTPSDGT